MSGGRPSKAEMRDMAVAECAWSVEVGRHKVYRRLMADGSVSGGYLHESEVRDGDRVVVAYAYCGRVHMVYDGWSRTRMIAADEQGEMDVAIESCKRQFVEAVLARGSE